MASCMPWGASRPMTSSCDMKEVAVTLAHCIAVFISSARQSSNSSCASQYCCAMAGSCGTWPGMHACMLWAFPPGGLCRTWRFWHPMAPFSISGSLSTCACANSHG